MKVTRSMFRAYRQQDATATQARNSKRKLPERERREARMRARLKEGKLPYTPDVMSWLSRKLDKPSTKISQSDVQGLLRQGRLLVRFLTGAALLLAPYGPQFMKRPTARLLIWCPDARGIIAAVSGFLAEHGANILEADQHSDPDDGAFCMRVEFETAGSDLTRDNFPSVWRPVAERFRMDWRIAYAAERKRLAILVSRQDHCLHDLLLRQRCGEIDVDIPFVISNHDELRRTVTGYGINFHHLPVNAENRLAQEGRLLELLAAERIDLFVLARYMQVLSNQVVDRYPARIINIHHGFLPAFAGARPYHQAYARGVKIVGATAHYVTAELDAGPIIAQDTAAITHRDTVDDLVRKGRDLERTVLAAAVRLHVDDNVLVHQNKTIVFG